MPVRQARVPHLRWDVGFRVLESRVNRGSLICVGMWGSGFFHVCLGDFEGLSAAFRETCLADNFFRAQGKESTQEQEESRITFVRR